MVSGSGCPVWFIDSESFEDDDAQSPIFDHQHPNYLVVKFFDADHLEKSLKFLQSQGLSGQKNFDVLDNIRDQVCMMFCLHPSPVFTSFTSLYS
jgi:hypothetical protein